MFQSEKSDSRVDQYFFWVEAYRARHFGLENFRKLCKEPTFFDRGEYDWDILADKAIADSDILLAHVVKGGVVAYAFHEIYTEGISNVRILKDGIINLNINTLCDHMNILYYIKGLCLFTKVAYLAQKTESNRDEVYKLLDDIIDNEQKIDIKVMQESSNFRPTSLNSRVVGLWLYDAINVDKRFKSSVSAINYLRNLEIDGINVMKKLGFSASDDNVLRRLLRITKKCIDQNKVLPLN